MGRVTHQTACQRGLRLSRHESHWGQHGIIGGAGQHAASAYAGTPFLTAEVGGGLQDTYFRRPVLSADDLAAMPTVLVGSGANLLGFYMFQGGRNPAGKLSSLQESQVTGYPTDVPVKSYDFQAPLGEFGGECPSFRRLKLMNYFLNAFGSLLAPMAPSFSSALPASPSDLSVPRVAARTAGNQGFLFFNNYLRGTSMPDRPHFSVALELPSGTVTIPAKPIDLPSGAYGIWPVNLDLGGLTLRYSTAQLFHRFDFGGETYFCFFAIPRIAPELVLETAAKPVSLSSTLSRRVEDGVTFLSAHAFKEPQEAVFRTGKTNVHLLLLSRDQAESTWRVPGQSSPIFSSAQVYADDYTLTLESSGGPMLSFSVLKGSAKPTASAPLRSSAGSPLLDTYTARLAAVSLSAALVPVAAGGPRDPLQLGPTFSWRKQPIPVAPADDAFERAAIWKVDLPQTLPSGTDDVRILVRYAGDVARLRADGRLIDDDFWNGKPWELSLRDLQAEGVGRQAELQVLPWPKDPPMYLESESRPAASSASASVELIPQYRVDVRFAP